MVNRQKIYYWKCDRPSAFYALEEGSKKIETPLIEQMLKPILEKNFGKSTAPFKSGGGQGNHLTFIAENNFVRRFLRIENGPEGDDFMEIEAHVLSQVRVRGIPAPEVYLADSSRRHLPFAFQVMEFLEYTDLNFLHKRGQLNLLAISKEIGMNVAKWQQIQTDGFGPFNPQLLRETNELVGLHATYADYFLLNWGKHLDFLVTRKFLQPGEAEDLRAIVSEHRSHLAVKKGCLVHKDLALWNILGEETKVRAFIDWDDTISGDATDDISLLACFHPYNVIREVLRGYESVSPLPTDFVPRFWLHLIRNMIVKAVIRVGANYFERQSDFFLINSGSNGASLRQFTRQRIDIALKGLRNERHLEDL